MPADGLSGSPLARHDLPDPLDGRRIDPVRVAGLLLIQARNASDATARGADRRAWTSVGSSSAAAVSINASASATRSA